MTAKTAKILPAKHAKAVIETIPPARLVPALLALKASQKRAARVAPLAVQVPARMRFFNEPKNNNNTLKALASGKKRAAIY